MEQNITAELRDIKPLLEIPDSSYYFYWGLIGTGVILVVIVVFFFLRYLWKSRKINVAKKYLEVLKNLDWKDTKASAYKATYYARLLATDEKRKEMFATLEVRLSAYKYKKDVETLDEETQRELKRYMQVTDESI